MQILLCYAASDLSDAQRLAVRRLAEVYSENYTVLEIHEAYGLDYATVGDICLLLLSSRSGRAAQSAYWMPGVVARHRAAAQKPSYVVLLEEGARIPSSLSGLPVVSYSTIEGRRYLPSLIEGGQPGPPFPTSEDDLVFEPPEPDPPPISERIPLALTFERLRRSGRSDWRLSWYSHDVGLKRVPFKPPYEVIALAAILKAFDALQHGSAGMAPQFSADDYEHLKRYGLWDGMRLAAHTLRHVGEALYRAIGTAPLKPALDQAIVRGASLDLSLHFPSEQEDAQLFRLPWEVMWDPTNRHMPFLFSSGRPVSFVRYIDFDRALPPPYPRGHRLRLLVIAPQAGLSAEAREGERRARSDALEPLIATRSITVGQLTTGVLSEFTDHIQQKGAPDIVHFFGQSRFNNGEAELLFDDGSGGEWWVGISRLVPLLNNVRLVVIVASSSGVGGSDLRAAVASTISAADVPAVLAMHAAEPFTMAARFIAIIYRNLSEGKSLQDALSLARQALFVEGSRQNPVLWALPTLTIRARDPGPFKIIDS